MSDDLDFGIKISTTGGAQAAGEFDRVRQSTAQLGAEVAKTNDKAREIGQSLGAAGRAAMNGDFGRLPGHMMDIAKTAELSHAAIGQVVLTVGLAVGATVALAKAYADASTETREMNNALAVTNGYAGLTAATMVDLGRAVADTSTLTVNASKQIVTQLVASGQISSQAITAVAKLADDYANATGKDAEKITPQLIKMFESPGKAAEELNRQMHFLSPTAIEHIKHLERIGELGAAQLELAEKASAQLPKHTDNLGLLEGAWISVRQAASKAWDAMLDVGRDTSIDQKLKDSAAQVSALQSRRFASPAKLAAAISNGEDLQQQSDDVAQGTALRALGAETNREQNRAADLARSASSYQQILLTRERISSIDKWQTQNLDEQKVKTTALAAEREKLAALLNPKTKAPAETSDPYQQLNISLTKKLELDKQSTELERLAIDLTEQRYQKWAKLHPAEAAASAERAKSLAQEIDLKNQMVAVDRAALEQAKQQIADEERRGAQIASFNQAVSQRIQDIQFETSLIGASDAEKEKAIALRQLDMEFQQRQAGLNGDELQTLMNIRDVERERLGIAIDTRRAKADDIVTRNEALKAMKTEARRQEQRVEQINKEVGRTLTDAIFRGFENGKPFIQNFRDSITNSFKTLVLRFAIEPYMTRAVGAVGGAMGFPGVASAAGSGAGSASSLSSLFSSGEGIAALAGKFTGAADSVFQNLGVSMGSQTLADIGNYGFGMPVIGGLLQAAGGNVAGGIGSTIGGIAGSYFGPIGTMAGSALGSILGSMLGGGGGAGYAQNTGFDFSGSASAAGYAGSVFSNSSNGQDNYRWFQQPLSSLFAQNGVDFTSQYSALSKQMKTYGGMLGADTSSLDNFSGSFSVGGIGAGGSIDVLQAATAALGQLSEQMALKLIPNLKQFQQSGETLGQTFMRLGNAAAAAASSDAFNKMTAALRLQDSTSALFTGDLSPLTNKQKLDMLSQQYGSTLTAAQGGDVGAIGNLSGISQKYLAQARGFYASSSDYTGIFNKVQGDVGGLVADTLTDQSIRFSEMGVSLEQIAANTQNLDARIAAAIAAAIGAQTAASDAIVKAKLEEVVRAIIQQNNPVLV